MKKLQPESESEETMTEVSEIQAKAIKQAEVKIEPLPKKVRKAEEKSVDQKAIGKSFDVTSAIQE